jgi:hypothetical protein
MMRSIFHWERTQRRAWLAGAVVVALTVTGVAIAGGPSATSPVSATFTATTVLEKTVQTCTGADGTYEITHGTYSGTAVSTDPHLNGPIWIDVRSVYNTTKNLGWLSGKVHVENATTGDRAHGNLSAVNVGGQLQGFLSGEETAPGSRLLANVSASFASATGFASAQFGAGTATNTAIVSSGSCNRHGPPKPPHPAHPDHPGKPTHPTTPKSHQ